MAVVDHLVYAVPALDDAINRFESATGIRPAIGGSHTGLGTHNALVSFGDSYLELIAPDPGQPDHTSPRPFGIDDLDGSKLVTFAIRPEPDETIEMLMYNARNAGFDLGDVLPMSRRQPNGDELHWRLTLPQLGIDGAVPFAIGWGATALPATTAPSGVELADFRILHTDPITLNRAYQALGLPMMVKQSGEPSLSASINGPHGTIKL